MTQIWLTCSAFLLDVDYPLGNCKHEKALFVSGAALCLTM